MSPRSVGGVSRLPGKSGSFGPGGRETWLILGPQERGIFATCDLEEDLLSMLCCRDGPSLVVLSRPVDVWMLAWDVNAETPSYSHTSHTHTHTHLTLRALPALPALARPSPSASRAAYYNITMPML